MFQQAQPLTICAALAALVAAGPATAESLTVTSLADSGPGSLREVLTIAESNGEADTIDFTVAGTISLLSTLPTITKDLEILGPGAAQLIVSGGDSVQILRIEGGQAAVRELTLANGLAAGGGPFDSASGRSGGGGGGLGAGGAILVIDADLQLENVVFANNRARGGNGGSGGLGGNGVPPGTGSMGGVSSLGSAGGSGAGSAGGGGGGGGAGGGFAPGGMGGPGNVGGGGGSGGSRQSINGFPDVGNGSGGSGAGCGGGSGSFNDPGDFAGRGGRGIENCIGSGGGGGGGAGLGGALYLRSGTLSMADVTFTDNEARRGLGGSGGSGGNNGQGKGGALFVDRDGTVLAASNLVRSGNVADDDNAACNDDDGIFSRGTLAKPLEPPTDLALDAGQVMEGLAAGTPVGVLTTADSTPGDSHAYTLVAGDGATHNAFFQVVGNELQTAAILDHETQPMLSIRVRTADRCDAGFERSFTITVLDVEEPPVAFDDAFTVDEDADLIVAAPGPLDNDIDPEWVGVAVEDLVTGPSHGTLLGGLAADGSFTYRPNPDFHGTDSFTYQATDGQAPSNVATVTITVDPVNDAPSFAVVSEAVVDQDLGPQSLDDFAFAISPGPPNEASQALTFTVTDNTAPALFTDDPALSADGTLSFTSEAGATGIATITVVLRDDGGTASGGQDASTPQSFDIEILDTVAPEVVTFGATPGGPISDCSEVRSDTAALVVTFSEDMADPAGSTRSNDVTNPDNYRLFAAGPDQDLGPSTCSSPVGDDVLRPIGVVSFDPANRQATLAFTPNLGDGLHRVVVCEGVTDLAGNVLSAEATVTFRQTARNALENGQVDCDLDGWSLASAQPDEIAYSTEDVDGALLSGSIQVTNLSGTSFSVGQCVDADVPRYRIGSRVRLDGAPDVQVEWAARCTFFDQPGCTGTNLGTQSDSVVLQETAGAWQPLTATFDADGTASGLCSFDLSLVAGTAFDAFLDALTFPGDIFGNGFESGDTTPWSMTIP